MVQAEFAHQAAREKQTGLPVSHFMDATAPEAKVKMELGFINFIVAPIWTALAQLLPEVEPCLEFVDANRAAWEGLSEGLKKPCSSTASSVSRRDPEDELISSP